MLYKKESKKGYRKWCIEKEQLDNNAKHKRVKPGQIWWSKLGVNVGREQDGGKTFERPVIILHRINYFLALVAPLTSQAKNLNSPFYYKLNGFISFVLISQVRVISTKRLRREIRRITEDELTEIKSLVKEFYKL